jgi:hypothetical protein
MDSSIIEKVSLSLVCGNAYGCIFHALKEK